MYATELNDIPMLQKIQNENDSVDDTFLAYNNCSVNYFAKYQRKINPPPTNDWAMKRDSHKISRERLINYYIQQEIIGNRRLLSFSHLKDCYAEFVMELYENANLEATTFSNHAIKEFKQN
ncbi:unnamed protein product [Psylliodes chrysocephalus]|uniref:Uncharacterized protein n=1 Tax=Psylliodes chrysocephalus TaxID=3402493 RepID=A0A9P0CX98_9CUCU|nr:unnamed protein product [Psylliodes chrysocephala]